MTKKTTVVPSHASRGPTKHIIPAPSPVYIHPETSINNSAVINGSPDVDLDNVTPADEKIRTL